MIPAPLWTEHELDFVRRFAPTMRDAEIARSLSRITGRVVTVKMVRELRYKLDITKTTGPKPRVVPKDKEV